MRHCNCIWLGLVLSILLVLPLAAGEAQGVDLSSRHQCYGKETVPVNIELTLPYGDVAPGATVNMLVRLTAEADLENVEIQLEGNGGASLTGAASEYIGSLMQGQQVEVDIPVYYDTVDRSAVLVTVLARHPNTEETMTRLEGVYTISRNGRMYHGRDGFLALDHSSVREDFESGFITEEEYQVQMREALTPDGRFDQVPRQAPFTGMPDLPRLKAVNPEGQEPFRGVPLGPTATITVKGTVLFTDENGATHGAYGIAVHVYDEEVLADEHLGSAALPTNGYYEFTFDNDDGIGASGRDIYVEFVTENNVIRVQDGGLYVGTSPVHDDVADGAVITENFTFGNTGNGPAGCVHVGASYIAAYVAFDLNGGTPLGQIPVNWPGSGAFYDGSSVNIRQGDRWDWDVLHHEYGHYVMDAFNFEANPGGSHSSASCAADVRPSKDEGLKLAWGESWPTYFGLCGQAEWGLAGLGMPRVGDSNYQDTEDASLAYSLETNVEPLGGDDNERSLMRIFWDLYDSASDGNDVSNYDDLDLFDVFDAAGPQTLTQGWAALRASSLVPDNQTDISIGAMCSDYGVGPRCISPTGAATVSPTSADFSWIGAVGCGTVAAGDDWDLVFYNPTTFAKILTVPGLGTTSTSLALGQLQTLIAGSDNHEVLWAVEGRSTAAPATGPYLGNNFIIFVNQPPTADAGMDETAECTGPGGTQVQLDGTGSSDPDGDTLIYLWSPSGIFDDPSSPTPTGTFTLGTQMVTLTVSDGLAEDSDDVEITIEDTTPPMLTCPFNIVVECSSYCGTPADDPQLDAFFDTFDATDICDDDLVTSLVHPACFPLGTTDVTWTATDDSGNEAECVVTVTVIDTTPPEISVMLNRYVLWPPNHKMADIIASVEVYDTCDENPDTILVDITSNEPDNNGGDGSTNDDIQGADFGTADFEFELRSERSGKRTGRIYTITYSAVDGSGNSAEAVVYVRVPHDQSGMAFAAVGFSENGTGFARSQGEFVLVIPSRTEVYGLGYDGEVMLLETFFDATALDISQVYVGNTMGVLVPDRWIETDQNQDGLMDVAVWYQVARVEPLVESVAQGQMGEVWVSDPLDPVGLHYVSASGIDYLVSDIFQLGTPVDLAGSGSAGVDEPEELPVETRLLPAAPNPFTGTTAIRFSLATEEHVALHVYNAQGMLVRTLSDEVLPAGSRQEVWDGRDNGGKHVSTGVYFVRLSAGSYKMTRKVVLSQ